MAMKGKDRHLKRLRRLSGPDVIKAAGRVVFVGSDMIRAEADNSIVRGSVTGKNHVPSAPGTPPNNDTGGLAKSITNIQTGPLSAEVKADAPYAAVHEFGSSKLPQRSFIRPARDTVKPKIEALFAKEMSKLVKGSGR